MNFGTRPLLVVSKSHYLPVPVWIISWCDAELFLTNRCYVKVFSCDDKNSPFINKITILALGVVCLKCLVYLIEWFDTSFVWVVYAMAMCWLFAFYFATLECEHYRRRRRGSWWGFRRGRKSRGSWRRSPGTNSQPRQATSWCILIPICLTLALLQVL